MDIFEAEMARRFVVAVEKIANALDRKDESQTEPLPKAINGVKIADAVEWADKWLEDNPVSEMWDMVRTLRDATEWQDEPQTETKMKTQNSNLTFEKRTMRDCYNCKRYETEEECIECHYESKDEP